MPLLESTFASKREFEASRPGGGLLVISAIFGSLEEGKTIDVTIPVQCMVDNSRIVLQPEGSYVWGDGKKKTATLCFAFLPLVYSDSFLLNLSQVSMTLVQVFTSSFESRTCSWVKSMRSPLRTSKWFSVH